MKEKDPRVQGSFSFIATRVNAYPWAVFQALDHVRIVS